MTDQRKSQQAKRQPRNQDGTFRDTGENNTPSTAMLQKYAAQSDDQPEETGILDKPMKQAFVEHAYADRPERMRQYNVQSCEYVRLDGGEVLEVTKPHIDKTIWYSDDHADPASKCPLEEVFYEHNLRKSNVGFGVRSHENDPYRHYTGYVWRGENWPDGLYSVTWVPVGETFEQSHDGQYGHPTEHRALTDREVDTLRQAENTLRTTYEKRLHAYWKRYSDKVYTDSYWADR